MWALPNISALNARAETEHKARKGRAPGLRGKKCECCGDKATVREPYYDIFGKPNVPKGYIYLCNDHNDNGYKEEGYFWCDGCSRYHVLNYTWEKYNRFDEKTGDQLCLRCAFNEALDSDDPHENAWVYQKDIDILETWLNSGEIDRAFKWLTNKAKHLIAVDSTYWEDRLIFQANVELDSGSGGRLTGFSSSESSREGGLREIIDHLKKVLANTTVRDFLVNLGAPAQEPARVALILDGAYQFSVSIGIYFEKKYTKGVK